MKDSNLRNPAPKAGGIAANQMRVKLGVPLGTRTPTNGFGDRYAAITSEIQLFGGNGKS